MNRVNWAAAMRSGDGAQRGAIAASIVLPLESPTGYGLNVGQSMECPLPLIDVACIHPDFVPTVIP
jgi:hypothetical protein